MGFSKQHDWPSGNLALYRHQETGMRHFHWKGFCNQHSAVVAFPTACASDDGRAHVLEHWVLHGGQQHAGPHVFHRLLERSVASYLNAETHQEFTAYPFSTPHLKDFQNILGVVLDAVFAPRLHRSAFDQEAWRVERDERGRLGFQGVVLNEMRGALGGSEARAAAAVHRHLLAGTGLEGWPGGTPEAIPTLTPDAVRRFHRERYRPGSAVILTAGPHDPAITHRLLNAALSRWKGPAGRVRALPRWRGHLRRARSSIPGETDGDHQVVHAWHAGDAFDPYNRLRAECWTHSWFGDGETGPLAKPLRRMGQPSSFFGVHTQGRDLFVLAGLEGLGRDAVLPARKGFLRLLDGTEVGAVDPSHLEAQVTETRYLQQHVTGGPIPPSLARLLEAVPQALYGGDPLQVLDASAMLQAAQSELVQPQAARTWLNQIHHRPALSLHLQPDPKFLNRNERKNRRDAGKQGLSPVRSVCNEPAGRTLPHIKPRDLRAAFAATADPPVPQKHGPVWIDTVPSRGVLRMGIHASLDAVPAELRSRAEWAWRLIPEWGLGALTRREATRLRRGGCCRLDAETAVTQTPTGHPDVRARLTADGLYENAELLAEILLKHHRESRIDHAGLQRVLTAVLDDSRRNADTHCASWMQARLLSVFSAAGRHVETSAGLTALREHQRHLEHLKRRRQIRSERNLWEEALRALQQTPAVLTCWGDAAEAGAAALVRQLPRWGGGLELEPSQPQGEFFKESSHLPPNNRGVFLALGTAVGHHGWAIPAPPVSHEDSGALAVLSHLLTQRHLVPLLRHAGGAYDAQARYHGNQQAFAFTTFRDPGFAKTHDAFEHVRETALAGRWSSSDVHAGVLRVVQQLDRPLSPLEQAGQTWRRFERATDTSDLRRFRDSVLGATPARLAASADRWFRATAHRVSCGPRAWSEAARQCGMTVEESGLTSSEV